MIVCLLMLYQVAAFFAFEACVGFYFPSIGTLRSKYIPDRWASRLLLPLLPHLVGGRLLFKPLSLSLTHSLLHIDDGNAATGPSS